MEANYPKIILGETVCIKLKNIYFDAIPWIECYREVAGKFTELKANARKFYADDMQMLKELSKYSNQDIIDAFHVP